MNTSMKQASAIAVLVSALLMLRNQGTMAIGYPTVHIKVVANYTGSSSFGIHCQSKDDDLGGHLIAPTSSYEFSFKPNLMQTTLFHCTVNFQGHGVSFVIYKSRRDQGGRCNKLCLWKVEKDGVAGYNWANNRDLFFPWTR